MDPPAARPPTTRRALLAAGASAGASALIVPWAASAATATPAARRGDAGWLARLARVELLALYCYDHVLTGAGLPAGARAAVTELRGHERAHVAALRRELARRGGRSPAGPGSPQAADADLARRHIGGRLAQLQGPRDALNLLLDLERVTVGVSFVVLIKLQEAPLSGLVAQIMANDAQHEAILHEQLHPGDIANAIPYGLVQGIQR